MVNRLIFLASLIAAAIIMVMLFFTTPMGIGSFGVFIFFMMLYVLMFGITTLGVSIFVRAVWKRSVLRKKDYSNAAVLAFWPIMILMIISIGVGNVIVAILGATLFIAISTVIVNKVQR